MPDATYGFETGGAGHAGMFGPTTGDRMRLGDTDLVLAVERDLTVSGDEVKFGGGKVIRDGMGQDPRASRAAGAPDLVITNALIVDHTGIYKADVGVRDGLICGIGKAGNPGLQDGVDPALAIGPGTEALAAEGMICTAGAIDSHIHFICPQLVTTALTSGVTTLLGGGTGPATGTLATTCTPGAWNLRRMLEAAEAYPVNLGFFGKGNSHPAPGRCASRLRSGRLRPQAARGLGHHPGGDRLLPERGRGLPTCRWPSTPTRFNESGFVENTIAAFRGRTIHTFHSEGAGGGHAPDILKVCGRAQRAAQLHQPHPALHGQHDRRAPRHADGLPPSRPVHTRRTWPSPRAASGRETIAAEDILHDLGAISIMAIRLVRRWAGHRRGDHPDLADGATR